MKEDSGGKEERNDVGNGRREGIQKIPLFTIKGKKV